MSPSAQAGSIARIAGFGAALVVVALLALAGGAALGSTEGRSEGRDRGGGDRMAPRIHFDRTQWPRTDFSRRVVPLSEFEGVLRRDGIDAIRTPRVIEQRRAEHSLRGREPVLVATVRGAARAYPLRVLLWHEIVNDRLGGRPIAVTYCPLCNSALVLDRRVGARTLEFGVSGVLRNSDLVMYDSESESWWQQLTGRAVVGRWAGTRLRALHSQILPARRRTRPAALLRPPLRPHPLCRIRRPI